MWNSRLNQNKFYKRKMIAFYQRLSGSNPTVVICSYSIDCFKTKTRKKIITLFSFLYHILKIYSAMQPYDLFEYIMFIFLEISIWNVYILLPICPKSPAETSLQRLLSEMNCLLSVTPPMRKFRNVLYLLNYLVNCKY